MHIWKEEIQRGKWETQIGKWQRERDVLGWLGAINAWHTGCKGWTYTQIENGEEQSLFHIAARKSKGIFF